MEERELLEERERDIRSKNQKKETKYLDRYDNSLQFIDKIKHLIYQWCVRVQANLNDTPVEKVRKMYSKSNDLSLLKESLKSIDKFLDGLNKLEVIYSLSRIRKSK